jgi:hypothetical protein
MISPMGAGYLFPIYKRNPKVALYLQPKGFILKLCVETYFRQ